MGWWWNKGRGQEHRANKRACDTEQTKGHGTQGRQKGMGHRAILGNAHRSIRKVALKNIPLFKF